MSIKDTDLHVLADGEVADLAPPIVKEMLAAGSSASVGPMAAVAGVIAEFGGRGLLQSGCREVMVENGGDIYMNRSQDCTVVICGEKLVLLGMLNWSD